MASLVINPYVWACIGLSFVLCSKSGISSDVPDGVVYTDLHKSAEMGSRTVLKCQFYGTPVAVFWKEGEDPVTASNLLAWGEGRLQSGSCMQDKSCEMDDEYSLIIKNISIADQGSYICRISNYKGVLIHNFTDVKVFAVPKEPYPLINECAEEFDEQCTISTSNPINITCTVQRYFPTVELFFLHESRKYTTTKTLEVKNTDGTKNKLISAQAAPSNVPYVCVAHNIPGAQDQRTATVSVTREDDGTTRFDPLSMTTTKPGVPIKIKVIKIAIPVALGIVIVAGVTLMFFRKHRKTQRRKGQGSQEMTPMINKIVNVKGMVSYYELWLLVEYSYGEDEYGNIHKLRETLIELNHDDIKDGFTTFEAYQALCKWKEGQRGNQSQTLEKALKKVSYDNAWEIICDKRKHAKRNVPLETLEHIVWHIRNTDGINKFMCELIPGRAEMDMWGTQKMVEVVKDATSELERWFKGPLELNHYVSLSLALERVGFKPVAKTFFTVPSKLQLPIAETDIDTFVHKLTGRHCRRLAKDKKEFSNKEIVDISFKYDCNLFDTKKMITDWVHKSDCSNYEKRCRLDDALLKRGRYDIQDHFGTISHRLQTGCFKADPLHPYSHGIDYEGISDDNLDQLVNLAECVEPTKKHQICEDIGIPVDYKGQWRRSLKEQLLKLRNKIIVKTSEGDPSNVIIEFHKRLIKETKDFEFPLTDEELDNVDKHVTSIDKRRELLRILKIGTDGQEGNLLGLLKAWRDNQENTKGRDQLQEALRQIEHAGCIVRRIDTKYICESELSRIAFDLLMEEVRPLIDTLGIDQTKVMRYIREAVDPENCTMGILIKLLKSGKREMNRQEFCIALRNIGFVNVARSGYFDYEPSLSELSNLLNCIAKEDMSRFLEHLGFSAADIENTDSFELMKLWKRRVQAVPRCYRLEIVTAMRAAGLHEVADKVLSGGLQSRNPNADVVRDICSRLSDEILESLCFLLDIRTSEQRETRVAQVIQWTNAWMDRFDPDNTESRFGHAKDRRQKINLLFRRGLFEFAEEITALENCQPQ